MSRICDEWIEGIHTGKPRAIEAMHRLLRTMAYRHYNVSEKQLIIFEMLAEGWTTKEVAQRLYLSWETVRTHIRDGKARMGAKTTYQAVAMVATWRY